MEGIWKRLKAYSTAVNSNLPYRGHCTLRMMDSGARLSRFKFRHSHLLMVCC